jgi:hypothetical protein
MAFPMMACLSSVSVGEAPDRWAREAVFIALAVAIVVLRHPR